MDLPTIDAAQSLAASRRPPVLHKGMDSGKAAKASEDFEAFFLTQVFEEMYSGLEPDSMFGGGQGESVFRSLLLQEYGKAVAHQGGVGMADAVQKEILKLQESKS